MPVPPKSKILSSNTCNHRMLKTRKEKHKVSNEPRYKLSVPTMQFLRRVCTAEISSVDMTKNGFIVDSKNKSWFSAKPPPPEQSSPTNAIIKVKSKKKGGKSMKKLVKK